MRYRWFGLVAVAPVTRTAQTFRSRRSTRWPHVYDLGIIRRGWTGFVPRWTPVSASLRRRGYRSLGGRGAAGRCRDGSIEREYRSHMRADAGTLEAPTCFSTSGG